MYNDKKRSFIPICDELNVRKKKHNDTSKNN